MIYYSSPHKDKSPARKEYQGQFRTGESDPEEIVESYETQFLLSRLVSTLRSDDAWFRYDTAKSYLDDLVEYDE